MRLVTGRGSFHNRFRVAPAVVGSGRSVTNGTEKDSVVGSGAEGGESFADVPLLVVDVVWGVEENPWQ